MIEPTDDDWHKIQEATGTDIMSIVMDTLNGHMGESFKLGRSDANTTMERISEHCIEAYKLGYNNGKENKNENR